MQLEKWYFHLEFVSGQKNHALAYTVPSEYVVEINNELPQPAVCVGGWLRPHWLGGYIVRIQQWLFLVWPGERPDPEGPAAA